jgi:hypothetical protein
MNARTKTGPAANVELINSKAGAQMGTFKYVIALADHSHYLDAADLPVMHMKNQGYRRSSVKGS